MSARPSAFKCLLKSSTLSLGSGRSLKGQPLPLRGGGLKISRELEWVRPYVEGVKHLVPIHSIRSIRGFKVPLNKSEHTEGSTTRRYRDKKVTISLLTKTHQIRSFPQERFTHLKMTTGYIDMTKIPVYQERILQTLAHELSHLKIWEHTPKRFELESKIFRVFGRLRPLLKELSL